MPISLHVGAHKTATTHLQASLRAATPDLLRAGMYYADVKSMRHPSLRLARALGDGPGAAVARAGLTAWLDTVTEQWPDMLMSEENLLGGLRRHLMMGDAGIYPQAVQRVDAMAQMLRRRPATLFLAVREPSSFLTSAFAMQVEGGYEHDMAQYLGSFDPAALSWTGLARRLLGIEGVAGLVVWRFEDYAAIRPTLLHRMVPPAVAARVPEGPPRLIGPSQEAFDLIRARLAQGPVKDKRALFMRAKRRFPRQPSEPALQVLTDEMIAACRAAYAADMADMARLPGVDLLTPPG